MYVELISALTVSLEICIHLVSHQTLIILLFQSSIQSALSETEESN